MRLLALALCLSLASCTLATRSDLSPDGTASRQIFAQLGGKGGYASGMTSPTAMMVQVDNERSFGQAMTAAGTVAAIASWASMEKAKTAADAATAQTATRSAAATETARITATERTATTLGGNPEANVGAVNAVKGLFR
jgi:hypothetical protein